MARYKVIVEAGAYIARDPTVVRLDLGADSQAARAYNVRAPVYELLPEGTEFESDMVPGPHLQPLDDEARARMAQYWKDRPGATLDPTRHLPLGKDPMVVATFESTMLATLERMAAASEPKAAETPVDSARLDVLTDALTRLTELVAAIAAPKPPTPARKAA
jgi:hypothetical protein